MAPNGGITTIFCHTSVMLHLWPTLVIYNVFNVLLVALMSIASNLAMTKKVASILGGRLAILVGKICSSNQIFCVYVPVNSSQPFIPVGTTPSEVLDDECDN